MSRAKVIPCPKCGGDAKKRLIRYRSGKNKGRKFNSHYCPACAKAGYKKRRAYLRAWHRQKKYGISAEETVAFWEKQKGCCGICKRKLPRHFHQGRRNFHIDHDHKTGKVRGLLCFGCNTGLGNFKDDMQRLKAAAAYLKRAT